MTMLVSLGARISLLFLWSWDWFWNCDYKRQNNVKPLLTQPKHKNGFAWGNV